MIEERIIRVTKENYDYHYGKGQFEKLELAYPKNWIGPLCKNACGSQGITYQGQLCEECKKCPFRKSEG